MGLYDFHLFYQGGLAVLHLQSPYQVWDFNGPYPLALLFAPFALLPEWAAYLLYLALNLFLLWKVMKWRGAWALLSFPVLFQLFVGQVDMTLALLALVGAPWTAPLLMAKPQVGLIVLPWLLARFDKKDWLRAVGVGVVFLAACFALRPNWVAEWMSAQPGMVFYARHASNLYWLIPAAWANVRVIASLALAAICLPIAFIMKKLPLSWSLMQLVAPLSNIYSVAVLAEWIGPLEMLLSWLAFFAVKGDLHNGMPLFVIALSVLIKTQWGEKINEKWNLTGRRPFPKNTH